MWKLKYKSLKVFINVVLYKAVCIIISSNHILLKFSFILINLFTKKYIFTYFYNLNICILI